MAVFAEGSGIQFPAVQVDVVNLGHVSGISIGGFNGLLDVIVRYAGGHAEGGQFGLDFAYVQGLFAVAVGVDVVNYGVVCFPLHYDPLIEDVHRDAFHDMGVEVFHVCFVHADAAVGGVGADGRGHVGAVDAVVASDADPAVADGAVGA